tara:strand:- start:20278 stop:21912 length:1635 start_codon:yes stop_codon:yes gene_type:complete
MSESYSNISRFLPYRAAQTPEACAVKVPRGHARGNIIYQELTFKELNERSDAVARFLQSQGVVRGTRVLLMVKPGLDLIEITFALCKLGAVPVIIDPGMGLRRFLNCVASARPEVLLGVPTAWALSWVVTRLFKTRICVGTKRWRKCVEAFRQPAPFPVTQTRSDELAAVLFTSGSTGAPKGVCYEHGTFEAQVRLLKEQYPIELGEVDLPMLPVFALFNPLLGMTTVVPEMNPSRPASVDPHNIVLAIQQCKVTNSFGSPTLWTKIGRHCKERGIVLPSMKRILMAGAPVAPSLLELLRECFPNAVLYSPYGATEAFPVTNIDNYTILNEIRAHTEAGAGTCVGSPLPEMDLKIIQIQDGPIPNWEDVQECDVGEIGEIVVSGPVVTKSYDQLPKATQQVKIMQGNVLWHRMGDVGYLDVKGRLWFCGRKVERVQAKQETFFTEPVEAVFNQHPRVFRSALIGISQGGEIAPALVVQPEKQAWPIGIQARQAFKKDLTEWAQQHPKTQGIREFFFAKDFPVDVRHNAKIHRLALAKSIAHDQL